MNKKEWMELESQYLTLKEVADKFYKKGWSLDKIASWCCMSMEELSSTLKYIKSYRGNLYACVGLQ